MKHTIDTGEHTFEIESSLSLEDTLLKLKKHIAANYFNTKMSTLDKVIVSGKASDKLSLIVFRNAMQKPILIVDFVNRTYIDVNKNNASKTYLSSLKFNIDRNSCCDFTIAFISIIENNNSGRYDQFKNILYNVDDMIMFEFLVKNDFPINTYTYHYEYIIDNLNNNKSMKAHNILQVSKKFYLKMKEIQKLPDIYIYFDLDKNIYTYLLYIIENYQDEIQNMQQYVELFKEYKNWPHEKIKRLIDYFAIQLTTEGLGIYDKLRYYHDYRTMALEMGIPNIEDYPRYIASKHDIMAVNYNIKLNELQEQTFINIYDNLNHLEYRSKDFSIITPRCSKDLIIEGSTLHHCVASYANKIIKGNSIIVFMRKSESIFDPYITIELIKNDDEYFVNQKQGASSRSLSRTERIFIDTYINRLNKITYNKELIAVNN